MRRLEDGAGTQRVVVVAAHPDDEVLCAGGTIAKHSAAGDEVHIAVLCEGASVRYGADRAAEIADQTIRAAAVLGVEHVSMFDLPDQRLDTMPISEVAGPIERLIADVEPHLVYMHYGGDVNRDHQIVAEATSIAVRPFSAPWVLEVLMFESASSSWGTTHFLHPPFDPSVFVDIADTLEVKLAAMREYVTETRDYPHPRSLDALASQARFWGSRINRPAAEAFVPLRVVR